MPLVADEFVIEYGYAQPRIEKERQDVLISGKFSSTTSENWRDGWELKLCNEFVGNAWVDPVTKTAMRCPEFFDEDFQTTDSGVYEKLGKADFEFGADTAGDRAKWDEQYPNGAGLKFLYGKSFYDLCTAVDTWGTNNRPLYFAYFNSNPTGSEDGKILDIGWTHLYLSLYKNGGVEVYRDSTLYAVQSITMQDNRATGMQEKGKEKNQYTDVLIMPMRGRKLLVFSPVRGDGFLVDFFDQDLGFVQIASTEKLKFQFYDPATCNILLYPVHFKTTGYLVGVENFFNEDMPPDFDVAFTFADRYYGVTPQNPYLVEVDSVGTTFTGGKTCRLRINMSGSSTSTEFIYGGVCTYHAIHTVTDNLNACELGDSCRSFKLNIPEDWTNPTFSCEISDIEQFMVDNELTNMLNTNWVPIRLKRGDWVYYEGAMKPIEYEEMINQEATITTLDTYAWPICVLDRYYPNNRIVMDAYTPNQVISIVMQTCAIPVEQFYASASALVISEEPSSNGDWNVVWEANETALEFLRKFMDSYIGDWSVVYRHGPTGVRLYFLDPIELWDVTVTKLFDDYIEAADYYDLTDHEAHRMTYYFWSRTNLAPNCNQLIVVGKDKQTQKPIWVFKKIGDSYDPTIGLNDQKKNWVGIPLKGGISNPGIDNLDILNQTLDSLVDKETLSKQLRSIKTHQVIDTDVGKILWPGEMFETRRRGTDGVVRAKTLDLQMVFEHLDPETGEILGGRCECAYLTQKHDDTVGDIALMHKLLGYELSDVIGTYWLGMRRRQRKYGEPLKTVDMPPHKARVIP